MQRGRPGSGASLRHFFFGTPAIQALAIQLLSFAFVLALAVVLPVLTGVQLVIATAALLQGISAAMLARLRGMASWWLLIHFLFPIAVVTLTALHLPSWLYLAAFLVLLGLYWTTFRTQVPYYPSTRPTWDAVNDLLPLGRSLRFVDIGSGFGGLVMYLARLRPDSFFTGVEVAPLPWLVSFLRALFARRSGRFVREDYRNINFAELDVVFAYLSPAAMPGLWKKASAEMLPGSLLLSYEFSIPGVEPHIVRQPIQGGPTLYGWYF